MVSLENTHHYPRLRPVKTLSKLYLKIMTHFSPSPWVMWTPVYEILVKTLHWAVSLSHWPHLLHPVWKGCTRVGNIDLSGGVYLSWGGRDSYGPTVILVTCAVAVTLPKLANQNYVNKLINQSKYWVELSKQQWYEHSKIITYCIYHSFQESLWYRLQVILLSNHSWTTSKFLANIYVKFKYKFKIFMMFSGQKSSFISLPEFKTITSSCVYSFTLSVFYSLTEGVKTTQTNRLKFRLRNNGISSINIFFSSSTL